MRGRRTAAEGPGAGCAATRAVAATISVTTSFHLMSPSYLAPWRHSKHRVTIRRMAGGTPRRVLPVHQSRSPQAATLQDHLDTRAKPGTLWNAEGESGSVRCVACGHRCLIHADRRGICRVRFNRAGTLLVPSGYAAGVQV